MKTLEEIKKCPNLQIHEIIDHPQDKGAFGINGYWFDPISRKKFVFVFSNDWGWEHLSVSLSNRCPTWDEMCRIKDVFFKDDERCVEFHPPKSEYVNIHPFCLHIWKPIGIELPHPQKDLVV